MYFEIVSQEGSLCEIEKHLIEYKKDPFSPEKRSHPIVTAIGFKPITF